MKQALVTAILLCSCLHSSTLRTAHTIRGARITCEPESLCALVEREQVELELARWVASDLGSTEALQGLEIRFVRYPLPCAPYYPSGYCAGMYYPDRNLILVGYTDPISEGALMHELNHMSTGDREEGH